MALKGLKYEWEQGAADPTLAAGIAASAGVSDVLARVLVARGVTTGDAAGAFLRPESAELADARLLPDAGPAVERVSVALERREVIAVHGHDDADGVCATAVMLDALRQLGASPLWYIPDRRTEGHGLSAPELDRLSRASVGLLITVDSCVSERALIARALEMGIDTIVTDHHEIPPKLPPARAVINPKLAESRFPYRYMAGVGVSVRVGELLVDELSGRFPPGADLPPWLGPRWLEEGLALAAIGSVADKVPLTGENRSIVVKGLAAAPRTDRPGLRALLEESSLWGSEVTTADAQRCLGPIFGRVSNGSGGNEALDALLCTDLESARAKARSLSSSRARWRESAETSWRIVLDRLAGQEELSASPLVIVEVDIPVGSMGHVTTRLADSSGRPTIVIARKNGEAVAEARGPLGFNFVPAFDAVSDLLLGYGGHPRAAGFSALCENVDRLRERLLEYASAHPPSPPPRPIDAEVPLSAATPDVALELERLAPFGLGNGRAVLLSRGVTPATIERARAEGLHFGAPLALSEGPTDIVYRVRHSEGVVFVNVIDCVPGEAEGT